MKPLLVGEANPYQADEASAMYFALHPEPPRASGGRLCYYVMGLDERTYLRSFDRIDLCHPKWSLPAARKKAHELMAARSLGDVIVICGVKVAQAFGVPSDPFRIYSSWPQSMALLSIAPRPTLVVIPHPSALNRAWHRPGAVAKARDILREAGVLAAPVAQ